MCVYSIYTMHIYMYFMGKIKEFVLKLRTNKEITTITNI